MAKGFKLNPRIKDILHDALKDGLEDSTDILVNKTKSIVPRDTGTLRNSIEKDDSQLNDLRVTVGTDEDYADEVEFGTSRMAAQPFLRPAIKESRDKMLRAFKRKLK